MRKLLFVFYVINGHLLFQVGTNPIGVYYANEIYIIFLIIFSFFYINQAVYRKKLTLFELMLFLVPFIMTFHSSMMALYYYDQPIIYGILESRRVFYILAIFPLVNILNKSSITMQESITIFLYACYTICLLFLLFRFLGFIPDKLGQSQINAPGMLPSWRIGAGQLYIPIALIFLSAYQSKLGLNKFFLTFSYVFFFLYLALIVQSRQLMFAALICVSALYLFDLKKGIMTKITGLSIMVVLVASLFIFSSFVETVVNRTTLADFTSMKSARSWSFFYAVRDFTVLGRGALSLLYESGYQRIYHENFYLIDIGIIGSIYRFGILYFFYFFILIITILKLLSYKNNKPIIYGVSLLILITSVTSSALEYYFYAYSIVFGIIFFYRKRRGHIC